MADVLKEVRIMFEGTDNVSKMLGDISGRLDDFGGRVASATQPLADLAASVLKAEAALVALGGAGLAYAVTEAGRFGDSVNEIASIAGASGQEIDQFRQDIINYASSSRQSFDNINQAIYEAISSGIAWGDSLAFLTDAEKLAVGGKAELADSVKTLAAVMNAYGGTVNEVSDYSDSLFTAVKLGVTTIPELSGSLGQVIGIAATAKVPFSDLMAAISALTLAGLPTSESITAIRGAITATLAPTAEAQKTAKEYGIELGVSALQAQGLEGYLKNLITATGGNVGALKDLVGRVEALNAVLILGRDESGNFSKALQEMANRAGATEAAYKQMADNFALINQMIINNFRAIAIEVGTPLQDEYSKIANGLIDIFKGIRIGIDAGAFDPLFQALESVGADIAEFLSDVAKVLPEALSKLDFSGLLDSANNLGNSLKGLFQAIFNDADLTTAEGLASAMQKIIEGVRGLTNTAAGILEAWKPFLQTLAGMAENYSKLDASQQTFAGNILGFAQSVNTIADNIDIVSGSINLLAQAFGLLSLTQIPAAIGALGKLSPAVAATVGALGPFQAVAAAIVSGWVIDKVLDATVPKWKEHKEAIADNVATMHGADVATDDWVDSAKEAEPVIEKQKDIWGQLADAVDAIPDKKTTDIQATGTAYTKSELEGIIKDLTYIPDKKTVGVSAEADEESFRRVGDVLIKELPTGLVVLTQAKADQASINKTKAAIDTNLPTEKQIQITLQGEIDKEIARINAQAETLQASFKYKAEVDIAEIENLFDTLQNQSDNIADMFAGTGDVLVGLADALGSLSSLARLEVFELMEEESRRRDALLLEQQKLTEAQIKYLNARSEAMKQGDGIITINATGIEAELDMVLRRIIELAQIRANEEGLNFLLGVT